MSRGSTFKFGRHQRPLIVLVDMDGVLCDFEGHFLSEYRKKYPELPFIPLEDRTTFFVADQYKTSFGETIGKIPRAMHESEGFFRHIPPIDGAIDAVKEMSGIDNVEVFICTSPFNTFPQMVKEKVEWVEEHLGRDWVNKLIITKDKTVVFGDILIEDRAVLKGVLKQPSWDHILFTCCHNKHLDITKYKCKQRLDNWTDKQSWRELIEDYKKRLV